MLVSLSPQSLAMDGIETDELETCLPQAAAELLEGIDPLTVPEVAALYKLGDRLLEKAVSALSGVFRTAGVLLIVCILLALADTLELGVVSPRNIVLAGVAAVGASSMTDLDSYLRVGLESLSSLREYSMVLLPVLSGAAAASGAVGAAAARLAATAMFMDLLLFAAENWIVPVICGYAALSVADAAVGNGVLKAAKKLMKSGATFLITGISMAFTAWITLSGAVAETADAFTARLTKTAVSAALPVVGGILSDAAGTLAAAAGALRGSVGVFGLLAVLGICAGPVISLGGRYLAYRLSAAACSCVSDKRISTLVEDLGTCFGLLLALNGAGALMLFVSIYSLIRTAV